MTSHLAKLEALFFVAGDEGLSLKELAQVLHLAPTALLQQLDKLSRRYAEDKDSAFSLLETAGRYRLTTKDHFRDLLQAYAKTPINQSLSKSALEVLAIIAYKQPITRLEIDQIRGVNSSGVIQTLRAYDLIESKEKLEAPGRPGLYTTTAFFLDYIGINQLEELPPIDETLFDNPDEVNIFKDNEETI